MAHAAPKCRRVFHRVRTNRCVNLLAFYPSPTVSTPDRVTALFRSSPFRDDGIFSRRWMSKNDATRRDISVDSLSTRSPFNHHFRVTSLTLRPPIIVATYRPLLDVASVLREIRVLNFLQGWKCPWRFVTSREIDILWRRVTRNMRELCLSRGGFHSSYWWLVWEFASLADLIFVKFLIVSGWFINYVLLLVNRWSVWKFGPRWGMSFWDLVFEGNWKKGKLKSGILYGDLLD